MDLITKAVNTKLGKKIKANKKKLIKILSISLGVIVFIGLLGLITVYLPGKKLLAQVDVAKAEVKDLQQSISDKDLDKAKTNLSDLQKQVKLIESTYKSLQLVGSLPFVNSYYKDGQQAIKIAYDGIDTGNILIKALEPYKDFLGIKGAATSGAKTTEDRISFLTQSIEGILPYFDTIETKVSEIETSLNQINASRYPETFKGMPLRSDILQAQELISQAHTFIKNGKPIISKTPWLLGKDASRRYLVLFQNNAELRPTGGFWTAYAIINVNNGKITTELSSDIYSLDAQFNSKIPAPRPILAYHINVPYFYIRDMNISPDYPTSAKLFLDSYQKATKSTESIDAVIGVDTNVLIDMVKVLGQVGVGGFGNFSAEPDSRCYGCPNIFYQLEELADKPKDHIDPNRKGFLGPVMNSLLLNAMGSEKSKMSPLLTAMLTDINQKHILFYFTNPETENAAELANISGQITQTDKNTDYFNLNDANMASAKSNMFITQKIKHEITVKNGKIEHKITITYTNPDPASNCNLEKGELCLNASKYRDWFRFYVPTGSTLIKMTGSEVQPVQYEELGKQVFEGFYGNKYPLYANSSLKTSVQYTTSVAPSKNYTLLLQKQPGAKPIDYELDVNGQKNQTFSWVADKTIKLSL
jgi:hypothetical protein